LFVSGTMGKVMRNIPVVVIAVLLMSLVEALLILPAHLSGEESWILRQLKKLFAPFFNFLENLQNKVQSGLQRVIDGPYRTSIDWALEWRYLTTTIAVALLFLIGGMVAGGFIKFSFMPKVDADNMTAYLTMPQGTPVAQTEAVLARIERAAIEVAEQAERDNPEEAGSLIQHISSTVGQQPSFGAHGPMSIQSAGGDDSHLGEVNVELLGGEDRRISSATLVNSWREVVGEVPGAVSLTFQSALFSSGDAISVQLAHRDFGTLLVAVERLKEIIAEYPGTKDIADSFLPGKKELKLTLTPEGRTLGLTLSDLARQVRAGFYGEEVQRIQRGRDDIRVMVRYPDAERRSLGDIEQMRVRLRDGTEVPFATVATIDEGRGYAVINRTDRRRVVTVAADVDQSQVNANEINLDLRRNALPRLAVDFPGLTFDFEGEQRQQTESLGSLRTNFLVAQVVIFALLAIPFRSYSQPVIIMSAIPFGLIGAVLGHMIMGLNLTLLSMFGMVALTGVVVNDSLIMVDLINRQREAGMPILEAIRSSGMRRFRPILLTTATTFLGLSPMIFETSLQAQFLIPMAASLGYGIVFATAITLILVPTLYLILEDVKVFFGVETQEKRVSRQVPSEEVA
jgi:multidrug efflux pump subunit AcrB